MRDELGAFVPHVDCVVQGAPGGPLSGLTFAAKDLFDVAGYATGSCPCRKSDPNILMV